MGTTQWKLGRATTKRDEEVGAIGLYHGTRGIADIYGGRATAERVLAALIAADVQQGATNAWRIVPSNHGQEFAFWIERESDGRTIGAVCGGPDAEVNAKAMSAGPIAIEALEQIATWFDVYCPGPVAQRAAAKAVRATVYRALRTTGKE